MAAMRRHRRPPTGFGLLFVCTGNICRSPFAEILTRHLLAERLGAPAAAGFAVASAGVGAVVGAPMHEFSRRELAAWRLDGAAADGFLARQLDSAVLAGVDLVLGVNTRHRATIVEREPAALARTFSLREFARLAAAVEPALLPDEPVARAHALVEQVRARRGLTPPVGPDADRVPDPMGGPPAAHHAAAVLIREAVETIVDVLAPRRR
jgi:protein-tyrosine phosphatase